MLGFSLGAGVSVELAVEHGALMKALIPGSQLAVLPGTTHVTLTRRVDLLVPLLAAFLD